MTVVRKVDISALEAISIETGLTYSVRPFSFDGEEFLEVISSSKVLNRLVRKKIMTDELRRVFDD